MATVTAAVGWKCVKMIAPHPDVGGQYQAFEAEFDSGASRYLLIGRPQKREATSNGWNQTHTNAPPFVVGKTYAMVWTETA